MTALDNKRNKNYLGKIRVNNFFFIGNLAEREVKPGRRVGKGRRMGKEEWRMERWEPGKLHDEKQLIKKCRDKMLFRSTLC